MDFKIQCGLNFKILGRIQIHNFKKNLYQVKFSRNNSGQLFDICVVGLCWPWLCLVGEVCQVRFSVMSANIFFFYLQPTWAQFLISLYNIHRAICRPSDHSVGRPPGPRFEPGTGGSSGMDTNYQTTTPPTRPPHLPANIGPGCAQWGKCVQCVSLICLLVFAVFSGGSMSSVSF